MGGCMLQDPQTGFHISDGNLPGHGRIAAEPAKKECFFENMNSGGLHQYVKSKYFVLMEKAGRKAQRMLLQKLPPVEKPRRRRYPVPVFHPEKKQLPTGKYIRIRPFKNRGIGLKTFLETSVLINEPGAEHHKVQAAFPGFFIKLFQRIRNNLVVCVQKIYIFSFCLL